MGPSLTPTLRLRPLNYLLSSVIVNVPDSPCLSFTTSFPKTLQFVQADLGKENNWQSYLHTTASLSSEKYKLVIVTNISFLF